MLSIKKEIYQGVIDHAQEGNPLEICGYLAKKDNILVKQYRLTNIDKSHEHFSFDPKEQFTAVKSMREDGLIPAVVYHSHPETPARPSEEDIKLAYDPSVIYMIVSLAEEEPVIKSFSIVKGEVSLVEIEVVE